MTNKMLTKPEPDFSDNFVQGKYSTIRRLLEISRFFFSTDGFHKRTNYPYEEKSCLPHNMKVYYRPDRKV